MPITRPVTRSVSEWADGVQIITRGPDPGGAGPVNTAPVLAPIGDRSGTEEQLLNIAVSATDIDDDIIEISVTNLPSFMTYNETESIPGYCAGTISGTPGIGDAGTYSSIVVDVDELGSPFENDTETIEITIAAAANQAPVLGVIANQSQREGDYELEIALSATDPDSDNLTFTAFDVTGGTELALNTNINAVLSQDAQVGDTRTGDIKVNSVNNDEGVYTFRVRVTDDAASPLSDEQDFTVTVTANTSPVITLQDGATAFWDDGQVINFSATDADSDAISFTAFDANGAVPEYTLVGDGRIILDSADLLKNTEGWRVVGIVRVDNDGTGTVNIFYRTDGNVDFRLMADDTIDIVIDGVLQTMSGMTWESTIGTPTLFDVRWDPTQGAATEGRVYVTWGAQRADALLTGGTWTDGVGTDMLLTRSGTAQLEGAYKNIHHYNGTGTLTNRWRMLDGSGTTFADSVGAATGSVGAGTGSWTTGWAVLTDDADGTGNFTLDAPPTVADGTFPISFYAMDDGPLSLRNSQTFTVTLTNTVIYIQEGNGDVIMNTAHAYNYDDNGAGDGDWLVEVDSDADPAADDHYVSAPTTGGTETAGNGAFFELRVRLTAASSTYYLHSRHGGGTSPSNDSYFMTIDGGTTIKQLGFASPPSGTWAWDFETGVSWASVGPGDYVIRCYKREHSVNLDQIVFTTRSAPGFSGIQTESSRVVYVPPAAAPSHQPDKHEPEPHAPDPHTPDTPV